MISLKFVSKMTDVKLHRLFWIFCLVLFYCESSFVNSQLRQLYYKKLESTDQPTAVLGTVESITNCTRDMCSCKSKCGKFAATPIFTLEEFHNGIIQCSTAEHWFADSASLQSWFGTRLQPSMALYTTLMASSVGCVRQPFGPPEASWVDFSNYEANGPITQIDVATYGIHTVGLRFYFGSVATDIKGYHSPQEIHNFVLDTGEYVNKVQLYHGTSLASTIDSGVFDMIVGIRLFTNGGKIGAYGDTREATLTETTAEGYHLMSIQFSHGWQLHKMSFNFLTC